MKPHTTPSLRTLWVALLMILLVAATAMAQRPNRVSSRTRVKVNTSRLLEIKNVDVIYISPSMIEQIPKASLKIDGNQALSGVMDGLSSIHIYTSSDAQAIKELRKTFAPILELQTKGLEQLMYVKDDNGIINVIGQMQGDLADELYMIVSDDDEYTVINFSGSFSRKQLEEAVTHDKRKRK